MSDLAPILVIFHVTANVVWIGSILAVAFVLSSSASPSLPEGGALARALYRALAVPSFVVSFVAGAARLSIDSHYYFVQTKFMHGKLFCALIVIALHHAIGGRAKKAAAGVAVDPRLTARLATALVVAAAGAIALVVLKPF
jgi:putative membrane protein